MSKHIHQVRITPQTPEWYKFREENGIGGSEISSVLATVSQQLADVTWTPPIKWYLAKIGEPVQEFTGNIESESGRFFEPIILQWYKYFDFDNPDQMTMFKNIRTNHRVNKTISPKAFYVNDKYPGFFYSPDAVGFRRMKERVLIETKMTTSMTARRYNLGIDPAFFCQIQQGMMIMEIEEADLCIMSDGRWFSPITVKANPDVHKKIQEVGSDMWKRVLKARMLKIEYELPSYFGINTDFLTDRQREGVELLSSLEPTLIGTEDELKFIKEMVKPTEEETVMQATEDQMELCKKYFEFGGNMSTAKNNQEKIKAQMILALGGYHKAEFEDKSFYSYKADAKGVMRLYVQDKIVKSDKI